MKWLELIATITANLVALLAAYHAIQGNRKSTNIQANVNGNIASLVKILGEAAITVPHETAAKVIAAPPADIPEDATPEETLALEWIQKLKQV